MRSGNQTIAVVSNSSGSNFQMHSLTLQICRAIGVIPFKLHQETVKVSTAWKCWSIFILFVYLTFSVYRCFIYDHSGFDPETVYTIVEQLDFYIEICQPLALLWVVLHQKSLDRVLWCLKRLLEVPSKASAKASFRVMIYETTMNLVALWLFKKYYWPILNYIQFVDLYLWYIQTAAHAIVMLYFHGFLCIMKEKVQQFQIQFKKRATNDLIKAYVELLRLHKRFWGEYQTLMTINMVQFFYDCLSGIKFVEIFLGLQVLDDYNYSVAVIYLFWYFYEIPFVTLIVYHGNDLQEKV